MPTQTTIVHLTRGGVWPIIHAVQNDTGRTVKLVIDDMVLASGSSGRLYFNRPDNSKYSTPATLVLADNAFTADLTQGLTRYGNVECQLKITSSGDVVSTLTFIINVEKDVGSATVEQLGYTIEDLHNLADQVSDAAIAVQSIVDGFDIDPDNIPQYKGALPDGTDLNNIQENAFYILSNNRTYPNIPNGLNSGFLIVYKMGSWPLQLFFALHSAVMYKRTKTGASVTTWDAWAPIGSSLDTGTLFRYKGTLPDGTDLNDVRENAFYLLADNRTYLNMPSGLTAGFLLAYNMGDWPLQLFYKIHAPVVYKRTIVARGSTTWDPWETISGESSGTGDTYHITKEYYTTNNSYTVNASPSIRADSNNYLSARGDTTDRTADIVSMLDSTGVCNLGPGNYYVANLQMPSGTTIRGSGFSTRIILDPSVSNGYAIKMGDGCTVCDLRVVGSITAISKPSSNGGRNGIVWESDYDESETTKITKGLISNVFVSYFTGSGIYFNNTGYGTAAAILIENAWVTYCWAGVNVDYWSEFNRLTNVSCTSCYYGCVNNGGNNVFTNCSFTSCTVGVLMDNTIGDKPNSSHGSFVGCTINHSGGNTGVAIHMINMGNGEVFTGLQVFYGQCVFELNSGQTAILSQSNFGHANVKLIGDGLLLLSDNIFGDKFQNEDYISRQSGTGKIIASNCLKRDGTVLSGIS